MNQTKHNAKDITTAELQRLDIDDDYWHQRDGVWYYSHRRYHIVASELRVIARSDYSFDAFRKRWFCKKKPVEEGEVTLFLIHYAQSQRIPWAGVWADSVLRAAKEMPELTTRAFVKTRMVRNRNRRIAGKYLFQNWARAVGIEITGKLEEFMARNSLLVARFYNQIAAGYECCKKQARVLGRVMRSVFIGWKLRDEEDEDEDDEGMIWITEDGRIGIASPSRDVMGS